MTDLDALTEALADLVYKSSGYGYDVERADEFIADHVAPLLAAARAEGFKQGWDECAATCGPAVLAAEVPRLPEDNHPTPMVDMETHYEGDSCPGGHRRSGSGTP